MISYLIYDIVDNYELCGQHSIVRAGYEQYFSKLCVFTLVVVNDIKQYCEV